MSGQANLKGFFRSLYDFSFGSFITARVLKVLYVLVVALYSLGAVLAFLLLLIKGGLIGVVLAIIFVPLFYLVALIGARLSFEFLMVVFRIGDDVHDLASAKPSPPAPSQPLA